MSERKFPIKIKPQYFLYFGSLVLFAAGAGTCGHAISVDIRAHDEADRLYENGTSENSNYAHERLVQWQHRDYLEGSVVALVGSATLAAGGVIIGSRQKRLV